MAKAISLVMPETFHGLCTWHIRQNALRHVNHLYQRSSQFNLEFEACIDLHEEEDEFLNAWNSLLVEHNVFGRFMAAYDFSIEGKMGMDLCSENIHRRYEIYSIK
jgi:zinc finger SWIM domain-containing protein 3